MFIAAPWPPRPGLVPARQGPAGTGPRGPGGEGPEAGAGGDGEFLVCVFFFFLNIVSYLTYKRNHILWYDMYIYICMIVYVCVCLKKTPRWFKSWLWKITIVYSLSIINHLMKWVSFHSYVKWPEGKWTEHAGKSIVTYWYGDLPTK